MDIAITQWINSYAASNAAVDRFFIAVTTFGVPLLVLFVVTQWWLGNPRPQARHACIAAAGSLLMGLGLAQIILLFIHRGRPYDAGLTHLIIDKTADWSFPSDHAIASTSIVFAWALNGMRRWLFIFIAAAVLICFSRIYVGMHYASDIVGGMGVALFSAWVVKLVYRPNSKLDRWITGWF